MRAFHNDPAIKARYVQRVRQHQLADEIIKGQYWENGKGCAVGCTIHGDDHSLYETELGIPAAVAYLQDGIFEGLPNGQAKDFPLQFLGSIRVGADLSLLTPRFLVWLLTDPKEGVKRFAEDYKDIQIAIQAVSDLHQKVIDGKPVSAAARDAAWDAAWAAARDAAWAAAGDAAGAAAGAAARDAAWAAAWAAAGDAAGAAARDAARDAAWAAAWDAAWAAARDAAWAAAWDAAWAAQKEKLLELLAAA